MLPQAGAVPAGCELPCNAVQCCCSVPSTRGCGEPLPSSPPRGWPCPKLLRSCRDGAFAWLCELIPSR